MNLEDILSENYIGLDEVFNSVVDGVIIANASRTFLYWNAAARKMLGDVPEGTDPNEFAKRFSIFDEKTGFYLPWDQRPMVRALNGEEYNDFRVVLKNADHPEGLVFSVNGKPIRSGSATVAGITTFRDVTGQVKLERLIASEKNFYERILNLMPGLVFMKDLEGKYIFANKSFLEFVEMESIVGKFSSEILDEQTVKELAHRNEFVLKSGVAHDFEEVIVLKNHTRKVIRSTRFPYFTSSGSLLGVCVVAKDVTRDIETEKIIEEERDRSSRISKQAAIGMLSAEIAHEFKNPLTILQTSLDVIRMALKDEKPDRNIINKKMDVINGTVSRMNKVAGSLGVLSRDSSNEEYSTFIVRDMLDDVKSLMMFRTKTMKMDIMIEESPSLDELMTANRVQISEVFLNILMNALDAVEGLPRPEVHVTCTKKGHRVIIKVFDNGKGVPEEIREKIFQPFFTTKPVTKGTGLGLSISKKIIEHHHGEMTYESKNNVHSFSVKLPLRPTH